MSRKTLAVLAVVALIALAGCSGIAGNDEHTHDNLHEAEHNHTEVVDHNHTEVANHSHEELHNHTETGTPDVRYTVDGDVYGYQYQGETYAELNVHGTVESFDAPADNVVVYFTYTVNGAEQTSDKYYVGNLEEGETRSFTVSEHFGEERASNLDSDSVVIHIEGDNFEAIEVEP